MIYCFDIDGTICSSVFDGDYTKAEPFKDVVESINELYESGNKIIIMSARGSVRKIDFEKMTRNQLAQWGLKYHSLLMNIKPNADIFVDDKAMNIEDYRLSLARTVGFVAGNFDVIHPGYVSMFREAKKVCNYLVVGLNEDPSKYNKSKLKPVLNIEDREALLDCIKHVDEVFKYRTEDELYQYLQDSKVDVRFLGDDYRDSKFTGSELDIPICYLNRDHGWSTTKFKKMIKESFNK